MSIDPFILDPFWSSAAMHKETVFFIGDEGRDVAATLLFPAERVLAVTSASGDATFIEGRDYVVDDRGRLVRVGGSRMPLTNRTDLAGIADGADEEFHRRQTAVSYTHNDAPWRGYVPARAEQALPRTIARLRRAQPISICLSGDSISEGYNASGFMGVPPGQPSYGLLVASAIERAYRSPIVFHNLAVAGWTADHGRYDVERVIAARPDLVIVAYGMNDAGYADADAFAANIDAIVSSVRLSLPAAEFVLVAPMLPNPDWDYPLAARFPAYRDALAARCGAGAALADMTTTWTHILERKAWYDLAGNGLNHPNDFGHRVYAQVILALLGVPAV